MKKIIFGLLVTVMFVCSGNAQNEFLKSGMVMLVKQAKTNFTKGTTYKDWLLQFTENSTIPTPQEDKFLKDVFQFVSNNTNSAEIYKNYDGTSLVEISKLYKKGGLTVMTASNQKFAWIRWLLEIIIIPYWELTGQMP